MPKTYVLDTNVLLTDGDAIYNFEDNNIIIPIGVIEELDTFKNDLSNKGYNARKVTRALDSMRDSGNLEVGVPVSQGILRIGFTDSRDIFDTKHVDKQILELVSSLKGTVENIVLVTNDANLRIRASLYGIQAEKYRGDSEGLRDEFDSGFEDIYIPSDKVKELHDKGTITLDPDWFNGEIYPNKYVCLAGFDNPDSTIFGRVSITKGQIIYVKNTIPESIKKVTPKNKEQWFLMDALLNTNIKLVCVAGSAGTGKTLLSTAAGYYMTMDGRAQYSKMLIGRPTVPMGRDIGFLPGDLAEKLNPWMTPIFDSLELITGREGKSFMGIGSKIEVEPLTYIRGRSIHNSFILIDECQNLTALEIKTIITRVSEGTKIVLTGDIGQIDNPYVDHHSNGLSITINAFKGSEISSHLVMSKGVRSRLAQEACDLL
jgi:PhoH-like ATPase